MIGRILHLVSQAGLGRAHLGSWLLSRRVPVYCSRGRGRQLDAGRS
jgi:hypothetical protein